MKQAFQALRLAKYQLFPLTSHYFEPVVSLANQVHGAGYLNVETLAQWVAQGVVMEKNASWVAISGSELLGYRISFAAGQWQTDVWCSTEHWPIAAANMAYFKSVAVKPNSQGQGLGQLLLQQSISVLKEQGARAGLAHLWRESPHNSAVRYFSKAGGQLITIHENRWQHLSKQGYDCPRCKSLCHCSAAEMVLPF